MTLGTAGVTAVTTDIILRAGRTRTTTTGAGKAMRRGRRVDGVGGSKRERAKGESRIEAKDDSAAAAVAGAGVGVEAGTEGGREGTEKAVDVEKLEGDVAGRAALAGAARGENVRVRAPAPPAPHTHLLTAPPLLPPPPAPALSLAPPLLLERQTGRNGRSWFIMAARRARTFRVRWRRRVACPAIWTRACRWG